MGSCPSPVAAPSASPAVAATEPAARQPLVAHKVEAPDSFDQARRPAAVTPQAPSLAEGAVKVGNPATFDPKSLVDQLATAKTPREKNLAVATRNLALAPNDTHAQARAVNAAAELIMGRPATSAELALAANAFAQGRTLADVSSAYAAQLTPHFEPATVTGHSSTLQHRAAGIDGARIDSRVDQGARIEGTKPSIVTNPTPRPSTTHQDQGRNTE